MRRAALTCVATIMVAAWSMQTSPGAHAWESHEWVPLADSTVSQRVFSTSFAGRHANTSAWTFVTSGGPTYTAKKGTLSITVPANATQPTGKDRFRAAAFTRCSLSKNFDVRVSYALPAWPHASGVRVGLVADSKNGKEYAVERTSRAARDASPSNQDLYAAEFQDGVSASMQTSDTVGQLRLHGSSLTGYVQTPDGEWTSLHSAQLHREASASALPSGASTRCLPTRSPVSSLAISP